MPDKPNPKGPKLAAPPPTAESDLEEKKKQLGDVRAQLADVTTQANTLTAQITVLETRIAEVKRVTDAYGTRAAAQQKELAAYQKLIDDKSAKASAGVNQDQKTAIDQAVQAVDADIAAKRDAVTNAQNAADAAKNDLDAATTDAQSKQDAYTKIQQIQKDADANLQVIKDLLDQASRVETRKDFVSMYFLVGEASTVAKGFSILTPEDHATKLKSTQADYEAAKTNLADKKATYDAAAKTVSVAQTAIATGTALRRATIVAKLIAIPAPAPAAPPAPAPAGPAEQVAPLAAAGDPPAQPPPEGGG